MNGTSCEPGCPAAGRVHLEPSEVVVADWAAAAACDETAEALLRLGAEGRRVWVRALGRRFDLSHGLSATALMVAVLLARGARPVPGVDMDDLLEHRTSVMPRHSLDFED